MKSIFFFLGLAVLAVFLNPLLAFWMMMILVALLTALSGLKPLSGFLTGGLAVGIVWFGKSIYWMLTTGSPLADRMGELMGIGTGITLAMMIAVLGFLIGGFSGLTGSTFRKLFKNRSKNIYRG